ncbi:response regulator [Ekhidna sp.]|uniref:response regulator n=1 Tax=Ekhidna sp. TaxID=2608089 RepID=UPI0035194675
MKKPISFTIVDDHRLFADGLARILHEDGAFQLQKVHNVTQSFIDELSQVQSDLYIIDIQLGELSGLDICVQIKEKYPEAKVILISMIQAPHLIKQGRKNGADGFIPKTTDASILKEMVNRVCAGETVFVERDEEISNPHSIELLTEREMEIIHLVKSGLTTRAIADQLFLSEFTVETHRKNILKKLKLSTANELIAYAYANHL